MKTASPTIIAAENSGRPITRPIDRCMHSSPTSTGYFSHLLNTANGKEICTKTVTYATIAMITLCAAM